MKAYICNIFVQYITTVHGVTGPRITSCPAQFSTVNCSTYRQGRWPVQCCSDRQTDMSTEVQTLALFLNMIPGLAFCFCTIRKHTTSLTSCHCGRFEESCTMVLQAIPHVANRIANMNMSPRGLAPSKRVQQHTDSCTASSTRLKYTATHSR